MDTFVPRSQEVDKNLNANVDRNLSAPDYITLIIPTFNRSHLLKETIDSILEQTRRPDRIIIIDDGSTDSTADTVYSYGSDMEYYYQHNSGKATALNKALSMISGGLVWIFDDDDLAVPTCLERMLQALIRNPDCGFVYGQHDEFEISDQEKKIITPSMMPRVEQDLLFTRLMERCFIFQGEMLVRRSCYDVVGPFDIELVRSQDYDMLLRLAQRFKAVSINDVTFLHRLHSGVRGTAKLPISTEQVRDHWRNYDFIIKEKFNRALNLEDYCPKYLDSNEKKDDVAALLQKFVIFSRSDLWETATVALEGFLSEARKKGKTRLTNDEIKRLSGVFSNKTYAAYSALKSIQFVTIIRDGKPSSLRNDIRAALALSLPRALRDAVRWRSMKDFRNSIWILLLLTGPVRVIVVLTDIFAAIMISRLSGDPGASIERYPDDPAFSD